MAGANREERERRLLELESVMVRRLSHSAIEHWGSTRWGVSARTVRDYMRKIRERWAEESKGEDRTERRDHLRGSLNDIYARAMSRSEVVRDSAGQPLRDENGTVLTREVPDLRTAVRAAEALARLDGLFQDKLKIVPGGALTPALNKFAGRSREDLAYFAQHGRWPGEGHATAG